MLVRPNSKGEFIPVVKDRKKLYAARKPVQPLLQYIKTFLAMSDGWIMFGTRRDVLGFDPEAEDWHQFLFQRGKPYRTNWYEMLQANPHDSDLHLYILCCMPELIGDINNKGGSSRASAEAERMRLGLKGVRYLGDRGQLLMPHMDYRITYDMAKKAVYYLVDSYADVWER
jgi:hypothetical protein